MRSYWISGYSMRPIKKGPPTRPTSPLPLQQSSKAILAPCLKGSMLMADNRFDTIAIPRRRQILPKVKRLAERYSQTDPDGRPCPKWLAVERAIDRDLQRMERKAEQDS